MCPVLQLKMFTIDVRVDRHGTQPIPLTEGIGGIMKKIMIIFLSVICLVVGGCSKSDKSSDKKEAALVTETPSEASSEKVEDTEQPTETPPEESTEKTTEDAKGEESNGSEEVNQDKQQNKTSDDDSVEEQKQETPKQQTNETQAAQPTQQTPEQTQPEQTQAPSRVEYSPQNVVALATAKTKAAGKILLTENLDNMLASGQISQEEYNEYYPYDGAGYYSVFVDSNMAEARSVSGSTKFNSEDDIAQYIADMLVLESGPYFLIEYAGTYDYYGKQCYEFRCYRA